MCDLIRKRMESLEASISDPEILIVLTYCDRHLWVESWRRRIGSEGGHQWKLLSEHPYAFWSTMIPAFLIHLEPGLSGVKVDP